MVEKEKAKKNVEQKAKNDTEDLLKSCISSFTTIYSTYMHIKVILK